MTDPHYIITLGIGLPGGIEQFLLLGLWADPPVKGSIEITDHKAPTGVVDVYDVVIEDE